MHKILLAEDDKRLASLVKDYLEESNYEVIVEENGGMVSSQVKAFDPDIVILDIMLPEKDGLSICQEIREYYQGAILILTARDEDADQIIGLEFGADDYVIKPVEPRILLARIRALLRRYNPEANSKNDILIFGNLSINFASREVLLLNKKIKLSSHEFDLLSILSHHAGVIMSRDQLFNLLYNRPYDGLDRIIDVRISQLRKKLGDDQENPFRIKTIWGKGYLFAPDAWT